MFICKAKFPWSDNPSWLAHYQGSCTGLMLDKILYLVNYLNMTVYIVNVDKERINIMRLVHGTGLDVASNASREGVPNTLLSRS